MNSMKIFSKFPGIILIRQWQHWAYSKYGFAYWFGFMSPSMELFIQKFRKLFQNYPEFPTTNVALSFEHRALSCNNTSLFNYIFSLNFDIYEDILLLEHLLYALNIWVGHHYHEVVLSLQPHFTCLFLMIVSKPPNLSSSLAPLLHMTSICPF